MSVPARIGGWITSRSKVVIVALLLTTALLGSGASMVDDDSSLDQFETDSPELEASEYASENFSVAGQDNATTVQLIVRGENVLTKESLIESLAFQQELRASDSIGSTLVENDSTMGVENLLVINAMVDERVDELEAEADAINDSADALNESVDELEAELEALNESADELEAELEALNESADELEAELEALNETADELEADADELERQAARLSNRGTQLEADFEQLEADAEELAQDQAALEARAAILSGALAEASEVQAAYEAGELDQAEADAQVEAIVVSAVDEAALDATQEQQFRVFVDESRALASERAQLEAAFEQAFEDGTVGVVGPDPRAAQLEDALNDVAELQTEYEQLNVSYANDELDDDAYVENATELESAIETTLQEAIDDAALEPDERDAFLAAAGDVRSLTSELFAVEMSQAVLVESAPFEVFEDEFSELAARGEELEVRGEALEEEAAAIEARGNRLARRGNDLEARGDELEAWGDELEARGDALEAWGDDLEARGDELEAWGDDLEAWGNELEAWGDELEARGDALEEAFEALEEFDPSLDEQFEYLESMSESTLAEAVNDTLGDDAEDFALAMMPSSYDPGSTTAEARLTVITQATESSGGGGGFGSFEDDVVDAQLELRELTADRDQEYVVFGAAVMVEEIDSSMVDSLIVVGPLALLFVVLALSVAYRDPLDIILGVAGIVVVLVWTFGFMGWTGIAFNQMMIAVPVLLIGLSIDYAIHVFMRHREQREAADVTDDVRGSMTVALAGVGVALVWVTATTAFGFLANLVSPIDPIREFGVVSAFGILAALVVFGALVPAVKVELDSLLERKGFDRRKRAFGTGESRFASALSVGAVAARKAPFAVLFAVLLVTAGGVYGATQVDTSFDDEDFLADSPPEWMNSLPEPFTPGEYHAKAELEFVDEHFQREDSEAQLLVRGDVTDDETLERVAAVEERASELDVVYVLANGEADVESPLSVMENVAASNDSFNDSFAAADTTGDGIPNENLEALYDDFFEVEENAANLLYRTDDGEYEAIRLLVSISGDADTGKTTDEMRELAAFFDDDGTDPRWNAIATGGPIVNHVVEQDLLDTVLESLTITLVVVFVFLTIAYWATGNSATLGVVTLLPVALSVSWILGTMYLLGMPFNVLTGMITSLTIGLGVAYSVHISSRYTLELERQGNVWDAMHTTVTGTGGALLGSAVTTVGGFGTLALAILPVLQQFGIITGLTIVYAFLASVIVLPTLLVLWTRYFGPDVSFTRSKRAPATPTASDGGREPDSGGEQ